MHRLGLHHNGPHLLYKRIQTLRLRADSFKVNGSKQWSYKKLALSLEEIESRGKDTN